MKTAYNVALTGALVLGASGCMSTKVNPVYQSGKESEAITYHDAKFPAVPQQQQQITIDSILEKAGINTTPQETQEYTTPITLVRPTYVLVQTEDGIVYSRLNNDDNTTTPILTRDDSTTTTLDTRIVGLDNGLGWVASASQQPVQVYSGFVNEGSLGVFNKNLRLSDQTKGFGVVIAYVPREQNDTEIYSVGKSNALSNDIIRGAGTTAILASIDPKLAVFGIFEGASIAVNHGTSSIAPQAAYINNKIRTISDMPQGQLTELVNIVDTLNSSNIKVTHDGNFFAYMPPTIDGSINASGMQYQPFSFEDGSGVAFFTPVTTQKEYNTVLRALGLAGLVGYTLSNTTSGSSSQGESPSNGSPATPSGVSGGITGQPGLTQ
ncbi:MAG: hypothetical protein ACMXYC_02135 [Candidatus Woesearchaeota archaeon]